MIINLLLIVTNILNIIFEFFNKSISILFWGILFIIFTIPHIVLYNEHMYSNYLMNKAGLFVVIFNLTYIITRIILNKEIRIDFKGEIINKDKLIEEKKSNVNIYYLIYIGSFLGIIYGIISNGYSILNFTWTDGLSYKQSFLEQVANFLLIGFSGIGCIALLRREKVKLILIIVIYASYVLITRSRYNIIPFIIPFLIYYIYSGETKKVIKSLIMGLAILVSVFLLQQIRYAGSLYSLIDNYSISEIINNTFSFIFQGKGEFGLSKAFYYYMDNGNNFPSFGEGKTYLRTALLPIPSSLLPFKPRDFAMDMWEAWNGMSTTIGTMHPILYGDVYANFGYWGSLMGIFYACFFKFNDRLVSKAKIESKKILYISIVSTMYVLLARGAVYNSIANAFWSIILINIVIFFRKDKDTSVRIK